jgi:pyridoxine 5-phosphate synthase
MPKQVLLGVNIDHVATLRQARGTRYPCPIQLALQAEMAGADGITLHLREDKRHIQPHDVIAMRPLLQTRMNLELALTHEMLDFALKVRPEHVCIVPEKREERTTEGGLDVVGQFDTVKHAVELLSQAGMEVSLFIAPSFDAVQAVADLGAPVIELHTGGYADAISPKAQAVEFKQILASADMAHKLGLIINAGHGLHYFNVKPIATIPFMNELNIGHAIIARALFCGFNDAVKQMKQLILEA